MSLHSRNLTITNPSLVSKSYIFVLLYCFAESILHNMCITNLTKGYFSPPVWRWGLLCRSILYYCIAHGLFSWRYIIVDNLTQIIDLSWLFLSWDTKNSSISKIIKHWWLIICNFRKCFKLYGLLIWFLGLHRQSLDFYFFFLTKSNTRKALFFNSKKERIQA